MFKYVYIFSNYLMSFVSIAFWIIKDNKNNLISPQKKMTARKLQNFTAFAIIRFSHTVNKQKAIDSILSVSFV
jgi:hypothetical protein